MLHLHLGHHIFNVLLACGQVGNDAFVGMRALRNPGLHRSDLGLGRILAVDDVLVERVGDRLELLNAADDVLVVVGHKGIDCCGRALNQAILVTDAGREVVEVFFAREVVDQASRDTGNFLASKVSLIWEMWPILVTREGGLLRGDEASGECLTSFLILACFVQRIDLTICCPNMDAKGRWLDSLETIVFSHPVVRLPQQV